jgi:TolB-like protein/Tfp pilus assembly protein PilF
MEKTLNLADGRQNGPPLSLAAPEAISRIQEQLGRILLSRTFRTAEGEKTLLRHVVDQTLQGRGAELKEYTVGVEALGRGESFDPRLDTIVRTQARNVRLRLARYYAGEGQEDPLRIMLPKGGYAAQFVEVIASPEGDATPALETPAPPREGMAPWNWKFVLAVAGTMLMLSVLWFTYGRPARPQVPADAASIAVLPFVNLNASADKENEILADGLTEELIDSLGRIPQLHVVARSSVFLYKGRPLDIRKAGRELNVRNVLEGSVRIANDHVRISARLEDTTNGYQIWSDSFDCNLDDAITVQRRISAAIIQSVGGQLAGAANLKSGAAPSPAAYRDFLRGVYYLHRGTAENARTSINYFHRAVAADPDFAPAYRGLADGFSKLAGFTSTPSREVIPQMRAAATRALELDDTLGEAHLDLARAYTYESNWTDADREYRRALNLSPSSAAVHLHYGYYLLQTGRLEEALAESRIALELDPLSPAQHQFAGRILYYLRRYDDAAALLQKAVAMNPSLGIVHEMLGLVYLARPLTYSQGLAESERARELMEKDPMTTSQVGYAYALVGQRAKARDMLRELERSPDGTVRALPVARVYAGLGDRDRAFSWLQKAVDQRDVALSLQADPVYDGLRSDPRFRVLLQHVNLTPAGFPLISMR